MRRLLPLAAALAACSVPSRDFADMSGVTDAAPDAAPVADAAPDAVPDATPDVVPDAIPAPLALRSVEPAANASGVDRATSIVLTFDAAITAESAAAAIQITDGHGQAVDGQLEVVAATATFRPARSLAMLATYQTRVSGELRGTGGGALAAPVTAPFTTRDGAWSASRALIQASFTCADTAFDATGAPITTWEQSGASGRRNVWAAVGHGEPGRLSTVDTSVSCPRLATSRGGTALAIWSQTVNGSTQDLTASFHTGGSGWVGPMTVENLERGGLLALALDDQGNAHVVYNTTPSGTQQTNATWIRRWDRTSQTWDHPGVLVETDDMAVAASLAASTDGSVLVAWRSAAGVLLSGHVRGSTSSVNYARLATGDQEVSAVDRAGNALLLWRAGSRVRARHYRAASDSWEAEEPIGDEFEAPHDPAVAFADDGRAVAVWANHSDERRRGLWARSFDPAHGWVGELVMIDRVPPNWGEPPTSAQPRVAFDGEGRAVAVWIQSDTTRERVWWNRRNRDGAWQGAAVLDDSTEGTASAPRLAVDRTGAAHVVWTSTTAGATSLRAIRFE